MERPLHTPESSGPPLGQTELGFLYLEIANTVKRIGRQTRATDVRSMKMLPQAKYFHASLDPGLVKDIFFPDDDRIEIIGGPNDTFVNHLSPHAIDEEGMEKPAISDSLIWISGRYIGTDIKVVLTYRIALGEDGPGRFSGEVEYEYSRGGRVIDDEPVEIHGELAMMTAERRDIRLREGKKIQRLLRSL